jgi:hypothetical protein
MQPKPEKRSTSLIVDLARDAMVARATEGRRSMSKFVAALISLLIMAIIASRQLFLFAVFRSPASLIKIQGGRSHLWLVFSAGITACIAGGLMFHFLFGRFRLAPIN